jgi:hypothetical protein
MVFLLITTLAFTNTAHASPILAPGTAPAVDTFLHDELSRPYFDSALDRRVIDTAQQANSEEPEDGMHIHMDRWRRRDYDLDNKPDDYSASSQDGYDGGDFRSRR